MILVSNLDVIALFPSISTVRGELCVTGQIGSEEVRHEKLEMMTEQVWGLIRKQKVKTDERWETTVSDALTV